MTCQSDVVESTGVVPAFDEALELARLLLTERRLRHVRRAGEVAAALHLPLAPDDRRLVVAAATLHDIGYSDQVKRTGFHPLDGGQYLREHGYHERLARLVANHSHSWLHCPQAWLGELAVEFPRERTLLADALVYADMSSSPNGDPISLEDRLADISERHPSPYLAVRVRMIRESVARVTALLDG